MKPFVWTMIATALLLSVSAQSSAPAPLLRIVSAEGGQLLRYTLVVRDTARVIHIGICAGFILLLAAATLGATAQSATSWPEADKLFRGDPRWLGSDAAFSIDLGGNRVLWLFGDTFVARKEGQSRRQAAFVRNTVGIQTGHDPSQATMKFYWSGGRRWEIFPSEGKIWMWPAHGARIGHRLIVFCTRLAPDDRSHSLGFKIVGWTAFAIDNPDDEPSSWKPRRVAEMSEQLMLGLAVISKNGFVYSYAASEPAHDIYLARWTVQDFQSARLGTPDWWTGDAWRKDESTRQPVMSGVSTEISVQADPIGSGYIEVNSQGFGASDIVLRRARSLEGPWSKPEIIYRPPESNAPDPFVYAGKSHPELSGAELVITYAANGDDQKVAADMNLYFPRFVKVNLIDRK
jgi:hypothetical protein